MGFLSDRLAGTGISDALRTIAPSFTPEEQAALNGAPTLRTQTPLSLAARRNPITPSVPLGPTTATEKALASLGTIGEHRQQNQTAAYGTYGPALEKERKRIDAEKVAFTEKQKAKRATLLAQSEEKRKAYEDAMELANSQALVSQQVAEQNGAPWQPLSHYLEQAMAAQNIPALTQAYGESTKGLKEFDRNFDQSIKDYIAPMEKTYQDAVGFATTLTSNIGKQKGFDDAYNTAKAAYESAVTQHDKDRAAYDMWKAKKAAYDQDSADRQADIDAGRYAVNPYQFMAQGAGINEIEALREQVNAGNLRPNMRVPDAQVAPEEVKDPGEFKTAAPVREHVVNPEVTGDAARLLGYKTPRDNAVNEWLPQVSTADTDTSSVTSQYESPAEKKKKEEPEPEKDASGNPVAPQPTGAGTLQQTSTGTASPTQQTATQAATPAPALPAQPTGSVAGQGSNTGQTPETQTPPKTEEKPDPFTSDEEKKEEQDSVF